MSVSIRVASRYSKALVELANSKGALDAIKSDMETVINLFEESREFARFIASPILTPVKKKSVLKSIFDGKVNPITSSFFDLMVDKGRENGLLQIAKETLKKYNEINGIQTVDFYTSIEMNDSVKNEISSTLAKSLGKKIELRSTVKEDLIGGYILRVDDKQIDHSVKGSLQKLRNEFVK